MLSTRSAAYYKSLIYKPMDILIIAVLLLVNGLFAMYEIALVSSSKARLETMSAAGDKNARNVLKQISEPEKILSTIQVGITLIGIVSGAFGGVALSDDLRPVFEGIPSLAAYADKLSIIVVVGAITYFSLIVGELVPKSVALNNPERIAVMFSPLMQLLSKLAYPFVWLLSVSTRLTNKMLGVKSGEERPITEEELKFILHQSSEQGVIPHEETEMLKDVFRFGDKRADELMTHRKDIVYMSVDSPKSEVLATIAREHYSKYLLCDGGIDKIVGVVSVKDIILMMDADGPFDLKSVALPPLFIPENLTAGRIVEIFKAHKGKFGIVISEYGSVEGIITLHDLSECIFGDIPEEDEQHQVPIVGRADGSYLVDGAISIDDFMDAMGIVIYDDVDSVGFNTLGGMAMYMLGSVPSEGNTFRYRNLMLEIVDMDGSRVDKLLVVRED